MRPRPRGRRYVTGWQGIPRRRGSLRRLKSVNSAHSWWASSAWGVGWSGDGADDATNAESDRREPSALPPKESVSGQYFRTAKQAGTREIRVFTVNRVAPGRDCPDAVATRLRTGTRRRLSPAGRFSYLRTQKCAPETEAPPRFAPVA